MIPKVNTYNPVFNGIRINAKENKHRKYLYNEVVELVKSEKVGAVFATDYISIASEKESIIEKLKKLTINFFKEDKCKK